MELLERYLQAIRKYLPWNISRARQEDILAELRGDYEAQLEDRQAELGRPLTEGEMIDWLKQLGSPIHVAARYQTTQYLIGPTIFPMYLYVLRLVVLWSFVVSLVVNAVILWTKAPEFSSVLEAMSRVPGAVFAAVVWVTLIFVVLEYIQSNHPHLLPQLDGISTDWSPTKLPPLEPVRTQGKKTRYFAQAAAEVIFGWLFLVWLLLVPKYPFLMFGPGWFGLLHDAPFQLAPVWWTFYWVAVAFNFGQNLWNTIDLVSGDWRSPSPVKPLFFKAGGIATIGVLLTAADHIYATLRNPASNAEKYAAVLNQLNPTLYHVMQLIFVIVVAQFAWELVKWISTLRK